MPGAGARGAMWSEGDLEPGESPAPVSPSPFPYFLSPLPGFTSRLSTDSGHEAQFEAQILRGLPPGQGSHGAFLLPLLHAGDLRRFLLHFELFASQFCSGSARVLFLPLFLSSPRAPGCEAARGAPGWCPHHRAPLPIIAPKLGFSVGCQDRGWPQTIGKHPGAHPAVETHNHTRA